MCIYLPLIVVCLATATPTSSPTVTATQPNTATPTGTPTSSPTASAIPTGTSTPTATGTATDTPTATSSPTATPTATATATPTASATPTATAVPALFLGKGVGNPNQNADCSHEQFNVDWWYNWLLDNPQGCTGRHIPMIWGIGTAKSVLSNPAQLAGAEVVLYLNEPNSYSQSNVSPAEAATMLAQLQAALPGKKWIVGNILNPGFNDGDINNAAWLAQFLAACGGCQIDAIGVHWYRLSDCSAAGLGTYLAQMSGYGYPLILTEYACLSSNSTYRLQSHISWQPVIEQYAEGGAPFSTHYPGIWARTNLVGTAWGDWYKDYVW